MESEEKVNILMVDDRPENLMALEAVLDDTGWNLVKAKSGQEALRHILKEEFAVVLLDVQMPEMDGFETARLIRQRSRSEHTPIIFVTAIGKTQEYVFEGYLSGAVDYIIKPFVPEILKSKVKIFVDLFQMREQLKKQAEELKAANEELDKRATNLSALNKELEAFSYSVSHDLRAPLRHIDGFSQILLEDYPDKLDEKGKHCIRRIHAGVERMSELIEDLLRLSRIARMEMSFEKVDLSALVQEVANSLQKTQPERQVDFLIKPGLMVNGDSRLLRIVLENLLGNAWKFTSKHPHATIEFGITEKDDNPVYFIRDNGAGFDMAQVDKLFSAFQRLHSADEFAGTGIGLATVARIIHRHGGRIWAEGAVEKGATFYFIIA